MERLKQLKDMGFAILLLHHTPKGNENTYKGSTAFLDLCDHVLGLERAGYADEEIEFDRNALYKFGTRLSSDILAATSKRLLGQSFRILLMSPRISVDILSAPGIGETGAGTSKLRIPCLKGVSKWRLIFAIATPASF